MITFYSAVSLDGFLATPDDSVAFLDLPRKQEEDTYTPFIKTIGAICMGSATYEFILKHVENGGEWPYEQPCWVFTTRKLPGRDGVTFVQGDVRPVVAEMAAHGNIWICGGGDLAAQFHEAGLLDEVVLSIAPVTLGAGKPLFPKFAEFELVSAGKNGGFAEITLRPKS